MSKRRDIEHAAEEIEQLFADLWQVFPFSGMRRGFRPQVDCYRTENPRSLTVVVDLAGADLAGVRVLASSQGLVIVGERPRPEVSGQIYEQMEIDYGAFERHVSLSVPVDVEAAEARYENGFLTITLPLAPHPAPDVRVVIEIRSVE
ncbi:MAG: Hsp20/alpha crystallin family protein [Actinomycetota bacterium]|nr:Hsp20/alpha crystallin family protein [Actinomycetota bacterium]